MTNMYSSTSPYYRTNIAVDYLDVMTYRDIPAESDDIYFEVTAVYQNRPDLLAYDLYGDPNLWWVFAMRNQSLLKDPIYDLVSGAKIYLPKVTTLKKSLGL